MTFVLKLPQSPLSPVTTMTSVVLLGRRSREASSGWGAGGGVAAPARDATLASARCICCAYGRALMIRCCARRSFDAATIFIALVICWVFLTARIRRRKSINEGMFQDWLWVSDFGLRAGLEPGAQSLKPGYAALALRVA